MAEFLTTTGVSDRLEQIIKRAKDKVIIISPYLKINNRLKGYLKDKDLLKINIHVVYGKNELQPAESTWLQNLNSIRTTFLKNLHAKCYLNEEQAIITSMNLYEFSQQNNEEMGILVSREDDSKLYRDIHEAAMRLVRQGEEVKLIVNPVSTPAEAPTYTEATSSSIPRSPRRPLAGKERRPHPPWNAPPPAIVFAAATRCPRPTRIGPSARRTGGPGTGLKTTTIWRNSATSAEQRPKPPKVVPSV